MPTQQPFNGIRFSVRIDVITVAIISVAVCAFTLMALVHYHKPASAPVVACQPEVKQPTIEITQTFFIPVPKVIVKKVYLPTPPNTQVVPQPEEQTDPVFKHRTPIITSALREPLQR